MPRVASVKKIGERLAQGLKRKGATTQQAMDAIGGVTLPTWYRWINGGQQGGCKDIPMLGLFLGLRPDELLLEDDSDPAAKTNFNQADEVGIENLRRMLAEMSELSTAGNPEERPVAVLCNHVHDMLKIVKSKRRGKK